MISFYFLTTVLSTLPLALAYYPFGNVTNATSSYAPGPTGTGSPVSSAIQTVSVGQNGLTFSPDTIYAKIGEEVIFQFFPKNHSVVQANFDSPCKRSQGGFFSGFFPTLGPGPNNNTFTYTINDEKPVWLYCSALLPSPHCAQGMVAVINPPASGPNTLDAFRAAAINTNTSESLNAPSSSEVGSPTATSSDRPVEATSNAASALIPRSGAFGGLLAIYFGLLL